MLAPACKEPGHVNQSADEPAVPEDVAVQGDNNGQALDAKGLPEVPQPSAAEVARHSLTHLPYRRWCKWCVAARMLSSPHWVRPPFSRDKPLLVFDYCFLKHAGNDKFLTVLVGRLYPSRSLFAVPCYQKGADDFVTRRLAAFMRASGVNNFSFMCDQEGALRTMVDSAIALTQGRGEWVGAVPENSAVGESQSNGRAERAVQRLEDLVRTFPG